MDKTCLVKHHYAYNGHVSTTILDVAKHAGVSPTTAKRAIRNPDKLKAETLEKVQRSINELGYEPDQLASALRSGRNTTIGLVIGSIVEPFFAELTREIGVAVRERGYTLLIADNEYDASLESNHLKQFHGNRVAGIILRAGYDSVNGSGNLEYLKTLKERGTAVIEIDYFYPDSPLSHVMLDNVEAVEKGVDYLHALGHTKIASLGTFDEILWPDERCAAFPEAMAKAGLTVFSEYQRAISPKAEDAYELTKYLMTLDDPPTALFAQTGHVATGALRALHEMNIKIPDDVSLLSFDNYPWTELVTPAISVISQPVKDMAMAAVENLMHDVELIKDKKHPPVVRQRFEADLIERDSCGAPRQDIKENDLVFS